MKDLIFPITMVVICLIGSGGVLYWMNNKTANKKKDMPTEAEKTAADFVNVKDIRGNFLYTQDNLICSYLKINPISVDLFSNYEKVQLTNILTAELSSEKEEFKFLAVSRPVDIKPLIDQYTELMIATENRIQKDLLKQEIAVLSSYALSGEVVERQFYIMLWEQFSEGVEVDLDKRTREIIMKFDNAGIKSEFTGQQDIVKLCNLINNPSYVHIEDVEIDATIPLIS